MEEKLDVFNTPVNTEYWEARDTKNNN